MITGANPALYLAVIDVFRFYASQISRFYDKDRCIVKEFPPAPVFSILLDQIQPSQFYVDADKVAAVSSFLHQ